MIVLRWEKRRTPLSRSVKVIDMKWSRKICTNIESTTGPNQFDCCCWGVDASAVVETFGLVCNVITGVEVVVGSAV